MLPPIEGDPASVRALAAALTSGAARLSSIASVLAGIRAGSAWESPAGVAFGSAVAASPPLLDALTDRYAGAAAALRTFVEVHERSQAQAQAASSMYAEHLQVHRGLEIQMDAAAGDAAELEVLRHVAGTVLARLRDAEQAHARATSEFVEADRRLARRLRALADDVLDDSWHYMVVARAEEAATAMDAGFAWASGSFPGAGLALGKVPGASQAMGATAAVGGLSRVTLALAYDEGSLRDVAVTAATAAGLHAAGGLVKGSQVGATRRGVGRGAVVSGRPSLTMRQRTLAGAREQWATSPMSFRSKVVRATPIRPTKVSGPWHARLRQTAQAKVDASVVGQWRLASAGGPGAQKMFAAGVTLEKTLPVARRLAVDTKPEEKAARPTYP
ncbi:hypothetical protein GCM10022415_29530 [Knoellia locipacati]|uniref:Uncharacterized protein n=1 Tax=Knoellia locipacati TaxID=882824 RepID=A0A512T4T4_9MICO|nr:hypothetical protein [Knoellia locipacati]GEQ15192.1 hypothetical protein KLO01_32390 [Knoellia locipacati]